MEWIPLLTLDERYQERFSGARNSIKQDTKPTHNTNVFFKINFTKFAFQILLDEALEAILFKRGTHKA